jgi:membrane protease YdiL (CAAX protease family)
LVFAAGGAVLYAVWPLVAPETEISTKLAALGVTKTSWTWFAVYFCAANPLIEEFLWRGLLGSDDTRVHPNDLLFAGYHGLVVAAFVSPIWALPVIAVCVFAGWLWRMLRVQSGGLLLPILTHIVADVSIAAAVYFRLYGR